MKNNQTSLVFLTAAYRKSDAINNIRNLIVMYKAGKLGGETMPEDARPSLIKLESQENYHFLTLPMALNYQRNSYKLWESAASTFLDAETRSVFYPKLVEAMSIEELREKLVKHKLALQPNKHCDTWMKLCKSINRHFNSDIRNFFETFSNDIIRLKEFIQVKEKKDFPYLSGHKIFNYWLHVMEIYTPTKFLNRQEITVAPDTHIIQATLMLGVIDSSIDELAQNRTLVSDEWRNILSTTDITPIDIHTPLWLWSKKGFPKIEN